ncbi:hypothetical protein GGI12_004852 [Dipsacomyces acuminosporus]|nr:hypothetical protein GGI12_004852 [Dipsacomyces acuminosporus]
MAVKPSYSSSKFRSNNDGHGLPATNGKAHELGISNLVQSKNATKIQAQLADLASSHVLPKRSLLCSLSRVLPLGLSLLKSAVRREMAGAVKDGVPDPANSLGWVSRLLEVAKL